MESNVVLIEMAKLTFGEMFNLWKIIDVQMFFPPIVYVLNLRDCESCASV